MDSEDQGAIDRILDHLRRKEQDIPVRPLLVPPTRAPLNNRSAWTSVGYCLETIKKDLQVEQCKRDFSTLGGHRPIQFM